MRDDERGEISTIVSAAVAAEAVVVLAIFLFAAITVNGHAIFAYIVGVVQ